MGTSFGSKGTTPRFGGVPRSLVPGLLGLSLGCQEPPRGALELQVRLLGERPAQTRLVVHLDRAAPAPLSIEAPMAQGDNVALPLARWPGPAATLRVDGWEQSPLGCLTHQSPTVALPALATAEVVVPALELLSPPRCVELQAQHLGLGTLCSRESEDRAAGATCAADSELCCGVGCVGRERCTVRLPRGARVALRAIADSESSFAEWSGACQQRDSCWLLGA